MDRFSDTTEFDYINIIFIVLFTVQKKKLNGLVIMLYITR